MPVKVTKSGPGLKQLKERLQQIKNSDVLVGIPAQNASRKSGDINNAEALFIFSNGSPIRNQPPRPVLEPSVDLNRKVIAPHLALAAKATLEERPNDALTELNKAGIIASNGAKRFFTSPDNGWAPNAPSTIARKGSDRPGIDTDQMRGAITWVVRQKGSVGVHEAPSEPKPAVKTPGATTPEVPAVSGVVGAVEEAAEEAI